MALESQPISIANVENGVSPFVHRAWAWNSTGTDRFTLDYPNDNILLNSQFKTTTTGWLTGNASVEVDTTNKLDGLNSMKVGLNADNTAGRKSRTFYRYNGQTPIDVSGSIWLKANKAVQIGVRTDDGQTTIIYNVTTEWQRFELPNRGYMVLIWAVSACVLWVAKPKVEKGTKATIYTPAPSEDFNNAYPTYEGVYSDTSVNGSTDPLKYTWTRMRGEDGIAGKDGVGIKSTQIMYAQSTSGTTAPTTGWTAQVPTLIKGQYLWTQTTWVYTDNTGEAGYTVSYNAKDGNNGTDGIAGKDGVGIANTLIQYVGSTSGTTKPTSGWSTTIPNVAEGNYLWTKTTWTYTDGTSETGYSVAKMGAKGDKGDTGAKGADGIAGKDGRGITNTETMYAIHTSGTTPPTTGWTASVPTLVKGNYLWTRNVWTYTDNTKETGYSVTYIAKDGNNGTDGIAGKDGVGIKSTAFSYATSTNGTTAPTTGWTTTVPTVTAGNYLWTRVVWTYTDNTTETGYSVARWGTNGTNGSNGVSVTGIQVEYAQTDTATEPSTGWSTTKPSPTVGKWYWTRTRNVLSNGTYTTWVVTVSFIGRDAVIVSDVAPSNPIKGTLWQKTTDPTVLEWNGTTWVVWGMSIENIVADNIVAENGVFKKITGLEINAGKFISDFTASGGYQRTDIGTYPVKHIGNLEISEGNTRVVYDIYNDTTKQKVGYGRYYVDHNGIRLSKTETTNITNPKTWNLIYEIEGIHGYDFSTSAIPYLLDKNDMVRRRDYDNQISLKAGFEPYGTVDNGQYPLAERHGRMVELFGAIKNTKVIPASGARMIMNNPLPVWARPRSVVRRIQQGSGSNTFLLEIYPDGTISLARYGTGSYIDVPVGAWINIGCVYTGQDVVFTQISTLG